MCSAVRLGFSACLQRLLETRLQHLLRPGDKMAEAGTAHPGSLRAEAAQCRSLQHLLCCSSEHFPPSVRYFML